MNDIYKISRKITPWGDYGRILYHGIANNAHRDRNGNILLKRSGPYVPDITFPGVGVMIVRDDVRANMASNFKELVFGKVVLDHIPEIRWDQWNLFDRDPKFYPTQNEPENYIIGAAHSQLACDQMPLLWEVVLKQGVIEYKNTSNGEIKIDLNSWDGSSIFKGNQTLRIYVSSIMKSFIYKNYPNSVDFLRAI